MLVFPSPACPSSPWHGVRGCQGVSGQPGAPRGVHQPRCLACRSSHHPRLVVPLLPSTQGCCGMEQLMNKSIPPGAEAAKRGCKQPSSAGAAGPMAGEERLRVPPPRPAQPPHPAQPAAEWAALIASPHVLFIYVLDRQARALRPTFLPDAPACRREQQSE